MPRGSRSTFSARQLLLCAIAAALIAGTGILAINSARDARSAIGAVQRTFKTLLALDRLSAALIDAETGQRGYLLTGDTLYLETYEAGSRRVTPALLALQPLVATGGAAAEQRLAKLSPLVDVKLDELALTIERHRSQGPDSALSIVRTDIGKRTMDEIRAVLDEIRNEENRLLTERLVVRDATVRQTFVATMALTGASLLIFAAAIASLAHTLRRRIAAERAATENHERLHVTLQSIGDAVIATDVAGGVVFLNPVAEALTGWQSHDAIGTPLERVFRIVNENSRETVESPVAKVLREGKIVGLANHTVLVARDGSELPIDDSGAPIRDAGGEVMGVVLVFRDVSARRLAEKARQELLRTQAERDAAEAANRAKDEFLAVLSHELRAPLAAASSWVEVIAAGSLSADDAAHAIATVGRNLRLQSLLISDLLDVSRIVAGKLTIDRVPMDVVPIVEAAVDDYRHAALARKIALRFEPGASCVALVDRTRFEQVLSNLLSNALRFTPEGGHIDVTLTASAGMLEIAVRDDGRGVAAQLAPHVFDRFWQSQPPTTRDHGGLGLGLSIAKYLVERHGGTIVAESEGEGRGTTLRIHMPTCDERDVATPRAIPERSANGGVLAGVDVLLVEDHADTRDAVEHLLRNRGATVRVAGTVAEALSQYRSQRPAIVVSDLGLPKESGIDLIQRIRTDEGELGVRTPAIAASGFAGSEDRQRAIAAGFDAHLPKPLDFAALLKAMLELLAPT